MADKTSADSVRNNIGLTTCAVVQSIDGYSGLSGRRVTLRILQQATDDCAKVKITRDWLSGLARVTLIDA